jgi:hypothetical protein
MTGHTYTDLGPATCAFCDYGHRWFWHHGRLRQREDGMYVLDLFTPNGDDDGNRVFPLGNRRVEVYLNNAVDDEPSFIVEEPKA